MPKTYQSIWIHLIWSTKARETWLSKKWRFRLWDFLRKKAAEKDYHLDFVNGVEDHVHCLLSLKPNQAVSEIAKDLKGTSSRWINTQKFIEDHFAWQTGFSAFSVSLDHVPRVRAYIKNQEHHHRQQSFDKEMDYLFGSKH